MNDQSHENVLTCRKEQNGKELLCRLQIFPDGSAWAEGEELEIIFEESPDILHEATTQLEKLGYTRIVLGKKPEHL